MQKPVITDAQREALIDGLIEKIGFVPAVSTALRVLGTSRVTVLLSRKKPEIEDIEYLALYQEFSKLISVPSLLVIALKVLGQPKVVELLAWLVFKTGGGNNIPIPTPGPGEMPTAVDMRLVWRDTNPNLKLSAVYGLEQGVAVAVYVNSPHEARGTSWIYAIINDVIHQRWKSGAETIGYGEVIPGTKTILLPAEHKNAPIVSMSSVDGKCVATSHKQPYQYSAVQIDGFAPYNPAGGHCRLYNVVTGQPTGIEFKRITGIATGLCRHQGHWVCCGYGEGIESSAGWFIPDKCFDVVDCGGRLIALMVDGRIQDITGGKLGKVIFNTIERPYSGLWDGKLLWLTTSNIDQFYVSDLVTGRMLYNFGGEDLPNSDGGLFDTPNSLSPDKSRQYIGRCIKGKGWEVYQIVTKGSTPPVQPNPEPAIDMGKRIHDPKMIGVWNECGGPWNAGITKSIVFCRHRNNQAGVGRVRIVHPNCENEPNRTRAQLLVFAQEAKADGCTSIGLDLESWGISEATLKMYREVADQVGLTLDVYPKAQMVDGKSVPYFGTPENGMRTVGMYAHFIGIWSYKSYGTDYRNLILQWRRAGVTCQIGIFTEQTRDNKDGNGKLSWPSVAEFARKENLVLIVLGLNGSSQALKDQLVEMMK